MVVGALNWIIEFIVDKRPLFFLFFSEINFKFQIGFNQAIIENFWQLPLHSSLPLYETRENAKNNEDASM